LIDGCIPEPNRHPATFNVRDITDCKTVVAGEDMRVASDPSEQRRQKKRRIEVRLLSALRADSLQCGQRQRQAAGCLLAVFHLCQVTLNITEAGRRPLATTASH
jgi:hypothetical protein